MSAAAIELNGKRYDALTGRLIGDAGKSHAGPTAKLIDGFVRPSAQTKPVTTAAASHAVAAAHHAPVTQHAAAGPAHPKALDIRRRPAPHHAPAHQPQHAKTLMRLAVSQPGTPFKRQAKAQARTDVRVKQLPADIVTKHSIANVDEDRLKRAKHVARSKLIHHFDFAALPQSPAGGGQRPHGFFPLSNPAAAAPLPASARRETVPAMAKQPSHDIFERALARADSHKQPPFSPKRGAKKLHRAGRFMSVAASSLAIVLIIGFIAYQNAAAIQLRLASSRAGVNATLPKWRPDGFAVGPFAYAPGTVTVKFHDADTARSFSVTQAASNWDSSALLSDFVMPRNDSYDMIQTEGNTIYTYGNNNATWVSGGIWYRLTTDGSLSTSQLVRLASSM